MKRNYHGVRALFTVPVIILVIISLLVSSVFDILAQSHITQAATAPIACATSELNVVAHHDDDILFMNPDINDSIDQKRCIETIFLTAGEWNGTSTMTREQYSASRMSGTRAAYASMANVANNWTRTATVINGYNIEVASLVGAPNIKLMYLNIHDAGNGSDPHNLMYLYKGVRASVSTLLPTGSPAGVTSVTYTKASLMQTILAIMNNYRVTLTRLQDYLPDPRLSSNHGDHIYGALFAVDALNSYTGISNDLHSTTVTYRDYNITESPVNLNGQQINQKNKILEAYKQHDPIFAIPGAGQNALASRMYYRWPVAPTWVAANKDGRLQAFDIQSGRLVTWAQDASGAWSGMQDLGNSSLQPGIGVGRNTDGTLQVFTIKQIINGQGAIRQDLQYIRQATPGGLFSTWQSLGNPGPTFSGKYDTSAPVIVPNGDGRLEVFLKDSDGDLATKVQTSPGGEWSGWMWFVAGDLMEMPAAILRSDGRIEIFSMTRGNVKHWIQREPNGPVVYDSQFTPKVRASSAPSAGFNQDGRPEIFYRHAGDGKIYTTWQTGTGWWVNGEANLNSQSSQGAPAVVNTMPIHQTGSRIALFARNAQTGFESTAQVGDNSPFRSPWQTLGTYTQHSPAAIRDTQNRIHFISVSHEGVLKDIIVAQP